MNSQPLYLSQLLRMTALDAEKDASTVAMWTYDPTVAGILRDGSAHPLTVFEVRKVFENWIKELENNPRSFTYAFRSRLEERLVGLFRMGHVQWVHGSAMFRLVIGEAEDWEIYARESLEMALNYAFDELNLFRVSAWIAEDDLRGRELYQRLQFYPEVRQRQAIYRDGRYLDRLSFGMLRPEWQAFRQSEVA